jgi:hypothetical protein
MSDIDALLGDELDGLNDPFVEHLPEAPTLTGRGQSEEMYGEGAITPIGRASSPPLFAQASLFPQCQQIRLWKVENGIPVGIGVFPASATEEDLVHAFPDAMPRRGEIKGTFKFRPLDTNGREIGQEFTVHISEHHAAIQAMRRGQEEDNDFVMPQGGLGDFEQDFIRRSLDQNEWRARKAEERADAERQRMSVRDEQMASERVSLAENAAGSVAAIAERMSDADEQRHKQAMESERARSEATLSFTASVMDKQVQGMREDREREGERHKSELDRERHRSETSLTRERQAHEQRIEQMRIEARTSGGERTERRAQERREWEQRMERERQEHTRRVESERRDHDRRMELRDKEAAERRTREVEDARSRDAERHRQHEMKLKEMDLQAQQNREHAERMMQITERRETAKQSNGIPALIEQGKSLLDVLGIDPKDAIAMIRGGGAGEWSEMIGTALEQVGAIGEKFVEGRANVEQARVKAAGTGGTLPPGYVMVPQTAITDGGLQAPLLGPGGIPLGQTGAETAHAVQGDPGAAPEPAAPQPKTTLKLPAQREARKALRVMVTTLASSPEEDWAGVIYTAISSHLVIYHYAADFTVAYALQEAGANPELANQIIEQMKAHPAVPSDLRYT